MKISHARPRRDVGGVGPSSRALRSRDIALQREIPRGCFVSQTRLASHTDHRQSEGPLVIHVLEGVGVLEQSDLELVVACYTEMYVLPRDQITINR